MKSTIKKQVVRNIKDISSIERNVIKMFERFKRNLITGISIATMLISLTPISKVNAEETLYVDVFIPRGIQHTYDNGDAHPYDPDGKLQEAVDKDYIDLPSLAKDASFQSEIDSDFPNEANYYWVGLPMGNMLFYSTITPDAAQNIDVINAHKDEYLTLDLAKQCYEVFEAPLNGDKAKAVDSFIDFFKAKDYCKYTIKLDTWNKIQDAITNGTSSEYYDIWHEWSGYYETTLNPKKTYYYAQDNTKNIDLVNDPNEYGCTYSFLSFYDYYITGSDYRRVGKNWFTASPIYQTIEDGEFPSYTPGQVQPINNYTIPTYGQQEWFYKIELLPEAISEPYTGEKHYQDDYYEVTYNVWDEKTDTEETPVTDNPETPTDTGGNAGTTYNGGYVAPEPISFEEFKKKYAKTDTGTNVDVNTNGDITTTTTGQTATGDNGKTYDIVSTDEKAEVTAKNIKGKKVKIAWEKIAGTKKYEIKISTNKKFAKKTTKTYKTKKLTYTIKKLKKGKTYYIKVRGLNGEIKWKWSSVVKVKVKK